MRWRRPRGGPGSRSLRSGRLWAGTCWAGYAKSAPEPKGSPPLWGGHLVHVGLPQVGVILRSLIKTRTVASIAALALGVGAPAAIVVNQGGARSTKQRTSTRPQASWTDASWTDA